MADYTFASEGIIDGIEYVTVLTATGDPVEYNIPRAQALASYGDESFTVPICGDASLATVAPTGDGDWVATVIIRDPETMEVQSEAVSYHPTPGDAREHLAGLQATHSGCAA